MLVKRSTGDREYKMKIRHKSQQKWNIMSKTSGADQEVNTRGDYNYREGEGEKMCKARCSWSSLITK